MYRRSAVSINPCFSLLIHSSSPLPQLPSSFSTSGFIPIRCHYHLHNRVFYVLTLFIITNIQYSNPVTSYTQSYELVLCGSSSQVYGKVLTEYNVRAVPAPATFGSLAVISALWDV